MRLNRFTQADRISSPVEIREILKTGERIRFGPVQLFRKKRADSCSRLAIAVKKEVGHSPLRNLIKRQLRELFRKNRDIFGFYDNFFYISAPKGAFGDWNWKKEGKRILERLK